MTTSPSFTSRQAIADETKCISLMRVCLPFAVWKVAYKKRAEKPWEVRERQKIDKDTREGVEGEKQRMREICTFKATELVLLRKDRERTEIYIYIYIYISLHIYRYIYIYTDIATTMGPFVLCSAFPNYPLRAGIPQLQTLRQKLWDRGRTVKVDYATTVRGRSTRAWCTEISLSFLSQKHEALTIITLVSDSVKGTVARHALFILYAAKKGFIWFLIISYAL